MKKQIIITVSFAIAFISYLIFFYGPYERVCSFYSMGGILTEIKGYNTNRTIFNRSCNEIQNFFEDMENEISIYRKSSFLSKLNDQPQKKKIKLPQHTFILIRESLRVSENTFGYFDITVLPALELWAEAEKVNKLPSPTEIGQALKKVSYKKLLLDEETHEITFLEDGMKLDLGGIAKGYMNDVAVQIMKKEGIPRGLINCGGGIAVYDITKHSKSFNIQIFNPDETSRKHENARIIEMTNGSLQTHGDYNRFHTIQGKQYSHIIDPHTGVPSGRCHSLTLKSSLGILADGYGPGLCAMLAVGKDPEKLVIQDVEIVQLKKR